jgi:hypothetical protein
MKTKLFRATTKIEGTKEPFVDWFEAATLDAAKVLHDAEAKECGVPMDARRTVEYVECNPETLKPL